MKKIILCDIDGTIADNTHRQHYLKSKKDWVSFFMHLDKDKPICSSIDKINSEYYAGKTIVFLTGRPELYREKTEEWLSRFFNMDLIVIMRSDNDRKNKIDCKLEMFKKNFKTSDIDYVMDNDEDLISLWEKIGLNTYLVNNDNN